MWVTRLVLTRDQLITDHWCIDLSDQTSADKRPADYWSLVHRSEWPDLCWQKTSWLLITGVQVWVTRLVLTKDQLVTDHWCTGMSDQTCADKGPADYWSLVYRSEWPDLCWQGTSWLLITGVQIWVTRLVLTSDQLITDHWYTDLSDQTCADKVPADYWSVVYRSEWPDLCWQRTSFCCKKSLCERGFVASRISEPGKY